MKKFISSLVFVVLMAGCYEDQFRFSGEAEVLDLLDMFSKNSQKGDRLAMIALTVPGSEAEEFAKSEWTLKIDSLEKSRVQIALLPDSALDRHAIIAFRGKISSTTTTVRVNINGSAVKSQKKWFLRGFEVRDQPGFKF